MRAGVCSVQQGLTAEAASVVKQAVSLAKRRGNAQVTPLHVASAMLASPTSLLRKACLQSHSHPLQCKALELCFNVALNRLPSSTSTPLLVSHHSLLPSLSNALVAAFKRAQAHQRRGSVENQQQPILALKIELDQLVVSILDDPSVSRVMREAGFSSIHIKNRVEQTVSISSEICHQNKESSGKPQLVLGPDCSMTNMTLSKAMFDHKAMSEDLTSVLETLRCKRNTIIVGESIGTIDTLVRGVIDKFEKGNVCGELKYVQFISLPLFQFRNLRKEEVEQKLVELMCLRDKYMGRGVILYLGDLRWVSEYWSGSCNSNPERGNSYYQNPLEHMIMELKKLTGGANEKRVWLMGVGTFQTYKRCKTGQLSLETLWDLRPQTIPADNLRLSLNVDSKLQTLQDKPLTKDGYSWSMSENGNKHQSLCTDSSPSYCQKEAQSTTSLGNKDSTLPSWLLQCEEERRQKSSIKHQECVSVMDLGKSLNSFYSSPTKKHPPVKTENFLDFSSLSPSSSAYTSSNDHDTCLKKDRISFAAIFEPKESMGEQLFWESEIESHPKQDLLSNPNSSPNSASSSEATEEDTDDLNMFKELNAANSTILSNALEEKVPQQKEIIQEIVSTILRCRNRLADKRKTEKEPREDTWLLFVGPDHEGKKKVAKELARLIFGSQSSFASTRGYLSKKRKRDESSDHSYLERLGEMLNENPHRVLLIDDMEQVDNYARKGVKKAIENGSITLAGGDVSVSVKDAIFILCSAATGNDVKKEDENDIEMEEDEEKGRCISLDLNVAIVDDEVNLAGGDIGDIRESVDGQFFFKIQ